MENNHIVFGVDEAQPKVITADKPRELENSESVLRSVLVEQLQDNTDINQECPVDISLITFDKVFRLGNPDRRFSNGRPRPIMAKCDREAIRPANEQVTIQIQNTRTLSKRK